MAAESPAAAETTSSKSGPWTDLGLTLPIFVGYHLGVVFLPVRNAADVVTRELTALADNSLLAYGGLTLAIGVAYVATLLVLGRGRALHWDRFLTVGIEGVVYAIAMRLAAGYVVGRISLVALASSGLAGSEGAQAIALAGGTSGSNPFAAIVMSLGAGFYEEIAFRVVGYGLGARLLLFLFPQPIPFKRFFVRLVWAVVTSLAFSGWHYLGAYGDPFDLRSFVFRAVCGLTFVTVYQFRGFAPAVWTHALYDIWVMAF